MIAVLHKKAFRFAHRVRFDRVFQHAWIALIGPVEVQPQRAVIAAAEHDPAPRLVQRGDRVVRIPFIRLKRSARFDQRAHGRRIVAAALRLDAEDHGLARVGVEKCEGGIAEIVIGKRL